MEASFVLVFGLIASFGIVSATKRPCPTNLVDNNHLVSFDHSEKCYEFITNHRKDWTHAKEDCALKGGSLVQIDDMVEEDFIMSTLRALSFGGDGIWIGLSDQQTEGQYVWTNGQPATFTYWGANEGPNGGILHFARDIEDCVALRYTDSGHWHDYHCDTFGLLFHTFGWICQYRILEAATHPPSSPPSNLTGASVIVG